MFLDFYKMKDQPFGVTPDPRFLYLGQSHREALASLYYGIQSDRGFVALIAQPGLGKTTLAQELHRRLPDAVVYDPEDVGLMLWKWMPPNGDFQYLPSWRELVVATALSLRRHHAETLIVPMSLIRDAYRAEILGGLADAGEEVLHVFLEVDAGVLRERLNARVTHPGKEWDQGEPASSA